MSKLNSFHEKQEKFMGLDAILNSDLSSSEKLVCSIIEQNNTLSVSEISKKSSISIRHLFRVIANLVGYNALKTQNQSSDNGGSICNKYTLNSTYFDQFDDIEENKECIYNTNSNVLEASKTGYDIMSPPCFRVCHHVTPPLKAACNSSQNEQLGEKMNSTSEKLGVDGLMSVCYPTFIKILYNIYINNKKKNKQKEKVTTSLPPSGGPPGAQQSTAGVSVVNEIFNYYKNVIKPHRLVVSQKRMSMIKARLREGWSVSELKSAVDGLKNSDFHNARGKYAGGTKYLTPEIVFRTTEQVEKMLSSNSTKKAATGAAANIRGAVI